MPANIHSTRPDRLRIMLVNGNFEDGTIGGTQTFTRHLAHTLVNAGHEVAVICQGKADAEEFLDGVRVFRIRPAHLRLGGDSLPTYLINQTLAIHNPTVAPKITRAIHTFQPDVCHLQMLRRLTPSVVAPILRRRHTALVQTVHEPFSLWNFNAYQRHDSPDKLYTRQPIAVRMIKKRHRMLSAAIHHVCAPSRAALAPYLADRYFNGVPSTIIPNSVPFDWGDPLLAARQRHNRRTKANTQTRFVFISRLDHYKGVRTLLEAFAALNEPAARLHIAGDGVLSGDVAAHARRDPRITFHGPIHGDTRRDLLTSADALLCPSTWEEPFGLVVLEAYAAGLPVIATKVGALPELVNDGETGLLVDAASSASLHAALRTLICIETRHRMALKAAARAWSFRPEVFLTAQLAVYRRALTRTDERTHP